MHFSNELKWLQKNFGKSFDKMNKYFLLIEKYNQKINLTGFSGESLWLNGLWESYKSLEGFINTSEDIKLLDIGAGAGFPSVPFKIMNPNIHLTIYEPIMKRCKFLKMVSDELNLNIDIQNIRAEESTEIQKYDYITARAVASLPILIEVSHHLLKIGGQCLFIKSSTIEEEILASNAIAQKLNIKNIHQSHISINKKIVNIVHYTKHNKTSSGFPRKWSVIKKTK